MSDFNVESFNYDYAHKCYLVYASGDTAAADSMYEKGKEVAESKKWINYVTKWQTEDVTVYDMDDEERKELDENGPAEKTGALAGEITGGVLAAGGDRKSVV